MSLFTADDKGALLLVLYFCVVLTVTSSHSAAVGFSLLAEGSLGVIHGISSLTFTVT